MDLTLTTSVAPVACTRPVTIRLASAASAAQCTTGRPRAVTSRSSCSRYESSCAQRARLDRRPAVAQLLPVGSSATTRARLSLIVVVACARFRRSWALPSARRAATGNGSSPRRCPTPRGAVGIPRNVVTPVLRRGKDLGQVHGPTPARSAGQPAADVHQARAVAAVHTSAPRVEDVRILSASMAVDTSAFLTAKVPPNPQHTSASGSWHQVDPAHPAQEPQRPRRPA